MRNQAGMSEHSDALAPLEPASKWPDAMAIPIWILASIMVFVPFARDTSAWDAVTLRVPGNQGNWWHVLVGLPFFLAYPMLWIRARLALLGRQPSAKGRILIWVAIGISAVGTVMVETPFLLHLAGTSEWQRVGVLGLGLGVLVLSALILIRRRRNISSTSACIAGLEAAYLANAALCLVVYSEATGTMWSRAGWFVSMVIVWPIALDMVWRLSSGIRNVSALPSPRVQ